MDCFNCASPAAAGRDLCDLCIGIASGPSSLQLFRERRWDFHAREPRLSRRVDPEHRATGRSPLVARPCSSARCCQTCASSSSLARALGGIICGSLQRSCARRRCCSALIDGRIHLRQHIGTRSELRFSCHPSHVPFHLEASEPFHVAREQFRTDGRPIPQWSRLKAGYSDDLGNRQALN